MDRGAEQLFEQTLEGLQRHWVALAGVALAAIMGGGAGKALSPSGLYRDPIPTQLISGPPVELADATQPYWPGGRMPDYVVGTDVTDPPREVTPLPATLAAYAYLTEDLGHRYPVYEAPDVYDRAAEAVAAEAVAEAREHEAFSVELAASEDAYEVYPALAPG